jgi:hypothetical protein
MALGPRSTGRPKKRVIQQRLPPRKVSRIPAAAQEAVSAGDDGGAFVK